MANIQKWINQLQSENPNKRYEACEELRVAPSIPEEAISALRKATKDPNQDVSDAAHRAIAIHTVQEISNPQVKELDANEQAIEKRMVKRGLIILSSTTAFVSFYLVACNNKELSSGIAHITGYSFVILCFLPILSVFAAIIMSSIFIYLFEEKIPEYVSFLLISIIGAICGLAVPIIYSSLYSSAWM